MPPFLSIVGFWVAQMRMISAARAMRASVDRFSITPACSLALAIEMTSAPSSTNTVIRGRSGVISMTSLPRGMSASRSCISATSSSVTSRTSSGVIAVRARCCQLTASTLFGSITTRR